ncbi:Phosphatidylinositol/phosphatidylcholine transfer protein sfh13 [Sarracenia purpurea var. burkii]
MFIVNAGTGFKKMLWPAAQKCLDPKTIAKIQVLEPKSLSKLLEVIELSQLPYFLGGSCMCSTEEGGCLRSNMGPWNYPDIMKVGNLYYGLSFVLISIDYISTPEITSSLYVGLDRILSIDRGVSKTRE